MLKKLYNNILILISVLLLSLTLLAHSPKLVFGDMIAVDFEYSGLMLIGTANATVGWGFTVNEQITVTQLGLFDPGGNGFVVSHDIGLWEDDVGQALLSLVTVSAGMSGILIDEFRYVPIAPIELTAGNTYVLGVQGFLPSNDWVASSPFNIMSASSITLGEERWGIGGDPSLIFPSGEGGLGPNQLYLGPNFQFITEPVPEPATIALLGIGLVGLGGRYFRKRIKRKNKP